MRQISVRDLRQQASRWLQHVQAGQAIEVTNRGRPVALLVPVSSGNELDRLSAAGRLMSAESDLLQIGPPLEPQPDSPLPSAALESARDDER